MLTIKNKRFTLTVDDNCKAQSLMLNKTGKECLVMNENVSLFSLTEERPFNNELKLSHPNRRTTFQANSIVREGNNLIVGFELLSFKAVIEIKEEDNYISFMLKDYIISEDDPLTRMPIDAPPVSEFRLLQLPVVMHKNYGEWLNVSHDEDVAVNILAASPYPDVGYEKRTDHRIMYADVIKGVKMKGCPVALIVTSPDELLDCIDSVEKDFSLPLGVESRRLPQINRSIYLTSIISPKNVDEHIKYAQMGGFEMMQIYYTAFVKSDGYRLKGDYEFNDDYPNGMDDLKEVLTKLKNAGIHPGFHFLHTHIGLKSSYVTPVADPRLNHTRMFTLAKPLSKDDTTIYVHQNPEETVMHPKCRVLQFDGELICFDTYETEPPYRFTGCERGYFNTNITEHNYGTIGGILDISEFGAQSVYIDQRTDLQDEIADKIAELYNAGFEFMYFDGSEGTNPPYSFNVPYAQYRVYRKANKAPIFCEGAAKAHFSWHMLSGSNAFDVFPTDIFKEKIIEHPFEEASRMANDFTRVNFGWWAYRDDTQPDTYEFGASKAASWDCPATVNTELYKFESNPRTSDILEVVRRWEDVRRKNWLTKQQKEILKDTGTEFTLLINEENEYELVPYYEIKTKNEDISAFSFQRKGKSYVVCWHKSGDGMLTLPISKNNIICEKDLGKERVEINGDDKISTIPISCKMYISSNIPIDELRKIFE